MNDDGAGKERPVSGSGDAHAPPARSRGIQEYKAVG